MKLNTQSMDRAVNVVLSANGNGGKQDVSLDTGVLAGVVVYDDQDATPKNTQLEILKNGVPIVESRHINDFRPGSGADYVGRIRPIWVECSGTYTVRATHETENLAADHTLQAVFVVIPRDQVHLYARK